MTFRTASPYHDKYMSPQYNTGMAIGALLGGLLSKNAAEREQGKINEGLLNFSEAMSNNRPSVATTTMDGQPIFQTDYGKVLLPAQYGGGQQGGLLSGITGEYKLDPGTANAATSPQAPGFASQSDSAMVNPSPAPVTADVAAPTTSQPATQSAAPDASAPSRFQSTTRGYNDVEREYTRNAFAKMREMQKTMGAQAFAKIAPQLMAQVKDGITQLKSDYADQTLTPMQDGIMTKLGTLDSNDSKGMRALLVDVAKYNNAAGKLGRTAMDMQMIKAIADNDAVTVDKIEVEGPNGVTQIQPVIKRKDGRPMLDKDGKQVAYMPLGDPYSKGVSPDTREHSNTSIAVANIGAASRGGGGGGGGSAKYVDVPGLGSMTVDQLLSAHEKARPKKKVVEDAMGNKTTVDEGNPVLFKLLDGIIQQAGGVGANGGGNGSGNVDYYQGMNDVSALIGSGKYSRQQIEAAVQQKYGDLAPYIIRDAFSGAVGSGEQVQFPYAPDGDYTIKMPDRNATYGPQIGF